jgi:hypothetical protein
MVNLRSSIQLRNFFSQDIRYGLGTFHVVCSRCLGLENIAKAHDLLGMDFMYCLLDSLDNVSDTRIRRIIS